MGKTSNQNNSSHNSYNVSNLFNDYDAFCCNTPTTYYKLNQFAFVSHTNKNVDGNIDDNSAQRAYYNNYVTSNEIIPPFSDAVPSFNDTTPDPFAVNNFSNVTSPTPLQVTVPRAVMPAPQPATIILQAPPQFAKAKPLANSGRLALRIAAAPPTVQAIPQAAYNIENEKQANKQQASQQQDMQVDDDNAPEQGSTQKIDEEPSKPTVATPAKKSKKQHDSDEEEDDEHEYDDDDDDEFIEEEAKPTPKKSQKDTSKKAKKTRATGKQGKKPKKTAASTSAVSSATSSAVSSPMVNQSLINKSDSPILIHIKPARKTRANFINYFPEKLYCAPYKYDVRVRFAKDETQDDKSKFNTMVEDGSYQTLTFKLLDGETQKLIKSNAKGEKALIVEKCKKSDLASDDPEDAEDLTYNDKYCEVVYRLCFTVCSFHNHRKPFIIQCSEKSSGLTLFESNPFHIYARKNNKDGNGDVWGTDPIPSDPVKTLFSGIDNEGSAMQADGNENSQVAEQETASTSASKRSRSKDNASAESSSSSSKKQKPSALKIQLAGAFQQHAGDKAEPAFEKLD